jgi:hypothetical protein
MLSKIQSFRGEIKKSRFKIWLRAALLIQFGGIFGFLLFQDILHGHFSWGWAASTMILCIPVGFLMSHLVPMQVNPTAGVVTLSLDKTYLALIWILVIIKIITGQISSLVVVADVIMCVILGLMSGRLGGIGIRVRRLKVQHGLISR